MESEWSCCAWFDGVGEKSVQYNSRAAEGAGGFSWVRERELKGWRDEDLEGRER